MPGIRERPDELPTCCPPLLALVCLCLCGHANPDIRVRSRQHRALRRPAPTSTCWFLTGIAILATSWTRIRRHAFRYSAGTCHSKQRWYLPCQTSTMPSNTRHRNSPLVSPVGLSRYAMNCVESRTLDPIIEMPRLPMPSCQTRSSASAGHCPTLLGLEEGWRCLHFRRHAPLAGSACTRFKIAPGMSAYSTGHTTLQAQGSGYLSSAQARNLSLSASRYRQCRGCVELILMC